jgi:Flp pilus assembly protein TadG
MKRWFRSQRGNVLLFTTALALPLMLIFAGLGNDLAYFGVVDNELQRTVDSAALAGAGKLGFDATVFPTVRQFAQDFGKANPNRLPSGPTVTLTYTTENNPSDDIVLGIWDPTEPPATRFTPSLNASRVNAVRCQTFSQNLTIPTFFLRLLGLASLPVAAQATAVNGPPAQVSDGQCLFPMAVSDQPFADGDGYGKVGCGQPVSWKSPAIDNTATWANIDPGQLTQTGNRTPGARLTRDAIAAAFSGTCNTPFVAQQDSIGVQGGEIASALADISQCIPGPGTGCKGFFNTKFNDGTTHTVTDSNGVETYNGPGWRVVVPVVAFSSTGPDNGSGAPRLILTYSCAVIVQVINNGWCGVANNRPGNPYPWESECPPPNGTAAKKDPDLNAIYMFFDCCTYNDVPPVTGPAPPAALTTRLRLVQ